MHDMIGFQALAFNTSETKSSLTIDFTTKLAFLAPENLRENSKELMSCNEEPTILVLSIYVLPNLNSKTSGRLLRTKSNAIDVWAKTCHNGHAQSLKKTKQLYKKKIFDELSPGWGLDEWNYSVIPILQTHYIDVFVSSTSGGVGGGVIWEGGLLNLANKMLSIPHKE